MKTYEAVFDAEENSGVYAISLVENPAMEGIMIALSKQEIQFKEIDKEERKVLGLVLEPNKPIYRNQNGEEFNIVFSEQVIKDLSYNFFKSGFHKNSTLEHDSKNKIEGVTFVESWIVEDSEKDKSANFGFSYPKGSWLAVMKIDNDEIWNNYVKTGKVQGFSIDAMLSLKEVNLKSEFNMSKEVEKTFLDVLKDLPNQIKLALTPQTDIKLGSIKTADEEVTIMYDGEMMSVGNPAWIEAEDGTKIPVPVGEHPLESGMILIVTEEGIVGELKEAPTEEPEAPVEPVAQAQSTATSDAEQAQEIANAIKSILVKYSEVNGKIDSVIAENVELKKQVLELSEQPASKPVRATAVQVDLSKLTLKERLSYNLNQNK
jgi:hypothetical protein